jgi:2-succinyl-6-hydroxy-2,4-cyclohexadiene-1-carboxylate synthase
VRLALVHGFTQTGASWAPIVPLLATDETVTPDAPGHGSASGVDPDLTTGAAWLADRVGRATWIGYSMGGRYCLHVALNRPEVVEGLVLVSTTAGIDDPVERTARREADDRLAATIAPGGVAAFVDRWLAGPMWATLPRDRAGVGARLANTAEGLAASLRRAGTGTQAPLWDRLHEIGVPTLVIAGGLDVKFTALGERLSACIPGSRLVVVPGRGHAVPWEDPDAFADAVNGWLSQRAAQPS